MIALLVATMLVAQEPGPPEPELVEPGVWLIPGGVSEGRQPDGNTVVIAGDGALLVFDTGRHAWHAAGIEALAGREGLPVAVIVNSHWHLDHISGNLALRARWPGVETISGDGLDWAVEGFLEPSVGRSEVFLASGQAPETLAEDIRGDIATIGRIGELRPDRVVTQDQALAFGGRTLRLRLARHAATEGDLWLIDPASRVAAVGDLVTLPAPFLDTACVDGWLAALEAVEAEDWSLLVPGHGPVMNREMFATWRTAFTAFVDCARSERNTDACAADWARAVEALQPDAHSRAQAAGFAAYYVGLLRSHGGNSEYCRAGEG